MSKRQHSINGDTFCQWKLPIFHPYKFNPPPLTDRQKIVTTDHVDDFYPIPNLVQIRLRGASQRIGEI